MNKTYTIIIITLILLIVAVTVFALYKANQANQVPAENPSVMQTPPVKTETAPAVEKMAKQTETGLPLTINTPVDGSTVTASNLVVSGKTVPKAEVNINNTQVLADAQGNFSTTVTLDEGENYLAITASNQNGDFAEQEVVVTYTPAQ